MGKFSCSIIIGLLMAVLMAPTQQADASKKKMYVSNRVKIVRAAVAVQGSAVAPDAGVQDGKVETPPGASPAIAPSDAFSAGETSAAMNAASVPGAAPSAVADAATGQPPAAAPLSDATQFASLLGVKEKFYTRKGRIDPFEPFLRQPEPEIPADKQAELTRRVPRTPLEKIELSQLRLTGVLRAENKTRALVQETSGKGYIVEEGTYIGNKGGQISKILKDRIKVSEKALDVFGKITVLERELKLQP